MSMIRRYLFFWTAIFFVTFNFSTSACFANGFGIVQDIINSGGSVERFIDISSPWTGAYIYEDMQVVGRVEIVESFSMDNLPGGRDRFFDFGFRDNPGSGSVISSDAEMKSNPGSDAKSKTVSAVKSSVLDDTAYIIVDNRSVPRWSDLFLPARK